MIDPNLSSSSRSLPAWSLLQVVEPFFRHKFKIAFLALTVTLLAVGVILFAPREYRSEARLFLQIGRESVRLDPTATTGNTIELMQAGREAEVATALEVLRCRGTMEAAVDRLTPAVVLGEAGDGASKPNPVADAVLTPLRQVAKLFKQIDPISQREEAILLMEKSYSVDAEHNSTVLNMVYDAETPHLAQHVLQTLVEVYRERHVDLHQTRGSKPFFTEQEAELKLRVEEAENKLRLKKSAMGLASVDARRATLEDRLANLDLTRASVVQSLSAVEARIRSLEDLTASMPPVLHTSTTVMPNTGADELRSQLYSLQVKLMNLEAKFSDDHPLVQSTRKQVEEAKSMVGQEANERKETVDSLNENHRALSLRLAEAESELAGFQAQLTELEQQRTATKNELLDTNDYEVQVEELMREVNLARESYYTLATKKEQARIDGELDSQRISNVNVAQSPTLAEKPVSPSKLVVAALSLLTLGGGSIALALGAERFNSRLTRDSQVAALLGLPVLANVPDSRVYHSLPGR